ncbi:YncE family protein [Leucobacter sp. HY1908]
MPTLRFMRRSLLALPLLAGLALAGCAAEPTPTSPSAPVAKPQADPTPNAHADTEASEELIVVTLARGDEIALVDPAREGAVETVTVGAAPWGVSVHGDTAYVTTAEGLAVVDLERRERVALVPYLHPTAERSTGEYRPGGLGVAAAPDGKRVYAAVTAGDGAFYLEAYDTGTGQFVGSVPVGLRPFDVLVAPDNSWAATVDHDGFTVNVVNAQTLTTRAYEVAPFGTEGGLASWEKPHYGAVDAAGQILLPYQGEVVVTLDPATGKMTEQASAANSHAHGTALAGRRLLTVGTGSFGSATGQSNLSILDLDTGDEQLVALDVPHETVAVWKDASGREFAAVAGGNTRDAGWDGVTLVALDDLSVRELPLPGYPQAIASYTPQV